MQTNYTIRAAQPADAAVCVPIIIDTIGSIAYTLSGSQDKQITLQVLTHFFEQPANRISYQNCFVIEVLGQIVGVLIDPLSAAVLFFVAWTVLMIFIYSVGYHNYGQPAGDHDHAGLPPHGATVE